MNPMLICSASSESGSSSKSWIVHGLVAGAAIAAAAGAYAVVSLRRSGKFRSSVVGIIPARFASSRFQGKPLVQILGKPMIQLRQTPHSTPPLFTVVATKPSSAYLPWTSGALFPLEVFCTHFHVEASELLSELPVLSSLTWLSLSIHFQLEVEHVLAIHCDQFSDVIPFYHAPA
ncbi:hypothetical protein HHK36_003695 [Tetracentron sinense]|uniref:Uncharacterized protein n=1 Tax=Tetracentron sinense TaxID=13715 RepID=A0A835DSR3_TETSI|nr:hypothetical protein HHK36_003695 [Tetracentron sinense]